MLPTSAAWHTGGTGAGTHPGTFGMAGGVFTGTCPAWGPQGGTPWPGETFRAGAVPAPSGTMAMAPRGWQNLRGVRTWRGDGALWAWLGTALQRGCDAPAVGTGTKSCLPRAVWLGQARNRLQLDPDPPGKCRQELVVAQTHWGGPGTLLPSMCPSGSRKPGVRLWDRSSHPASPTSPRQFPEPRHSPEAMGMGALGCPGHGCYPARRKGGQSLPAPRKAAPMPAQRAFPLPCCPQAPLPRSARLGWPLCPAAVDTVRCWGVGGRGTPTARIGRCCAPLLVPLAAPSLSPAKEAPRGR